MTDHHALPAIGQTDAAGCVFCDLIAYPERDRVCLPVGDHFCVIPAAAQRPTNPGHMLLMPTAHVPSLQQLPADQSHDLLLALKIVTDAVQEAFAATGTAVRCNLGPPGQSVAHLHFHVIPRHLEDQNLATSSLPVPLPDRQRQMQSLAPRLASRLTRWQDQTSPSAESQARTEAT